MTSKEVAAEAETPLQAEQERDAKAHAKLTIDLMRDREEAQEKLRERGPEETQRGAHRRCLPRRKDDSGLSGKFARRGPQDARAIGQGLLSDKQDGHRAADQRAREGRGRLQALPGAGLDKVGDVLFDFTKSLTRRLDQDEGCLERHPRDHQRYVPAHLDRDGRAGAGHQILIPVGRDQQGPEGQHGRHGLDLSGLLKLFGGGGTGHDRGAGRGRCKARHRVGRPWADGECRGCRGWGGRPASARAISRRAQLTASLAAISTGRRLLWPRRRIGGRGWAGPVARGDCWQCRAHRWPALLAPLSARSSARPFLLIQQPPGQ